MSMYTPFPVSMPLAYQAPIRSHYPERHCAFGEIKKAVDEELLNRDLESERKQDANPWCGLTWCGKHCHTIFGACRARS